MEIACPLIILFHLITVTERGTRNMERRTRKVYFGFKHNLITPLCFIMNNLSIKVKIQTCIKYL